MSKEKVYCGNARIIETQYGELTKVRFSADDLKTLTDNLDNGWVNAVVKEKKEPKEGKPTHYLEIDFWKPEPKDGADREVAKETSPPAPF